MLQPGRRKTLNIRRRGALVTEVDEAGGRRLAARLGNTGCNDRNRGAVTSGHTFHERRQELIGEGHHRITDADLSVHPQLTLPIGAFIKRIENNDQPRQMSRLHSVLHHDQQQGSKVLHRLLLQVHPHTDAFTAGHPVPKVLERSGRVAAKRSNPQFGAQESNAQLNGGRCISKDVKMRQHYSAVLCARQLPHNLGQQRRFAAAVMAVQPGHCKASAAVHD